MNPQSILVCACELIVKTSAILLATRLVLAAWRGASAAQRQIVWLAALVTALLLPLSILSAPHWRITYQKDVPVQIPTVMNIDPMTVHGHSESIESTPVVSSKRPDWHELLLFAWLLGAVLILSHTIAGEIRLSLIKRASFRVNDPRVVRFTKEISDALGIRRQIDVRISPRCLVPFTWGYARPTLILPSESVKLDDASLLAILYHEAAHIAHNDYLGRWLGQIACALYWPNPLVWNANHSLRLAQEQAADDQVLRAGGIADDYASQLFEAARHASLEPLFSNNALAMAHPSTLETRLLAIVDPMRKRTSLSRNAKLVALSASVLVLVLSTSVQLNAEEKSGKPASELIATNMDKNPIYLKAKKLVLKEINFNEATLQESVDYLRMKSKELDPQKVGVNIVVKPGVNGTEPPKINIQLANIPILEALKEVTELAGYALKCDETAFILEPKGASPKQADSGTLENNAIFKKGGFKLLANI